MKQYDGNIVSMNIDGQMIIYNDPIKIIWKGYKFAAKTHMLACGMKAASLWFDDNIDKIFKICINKTYHSNRGGK